jgi:hypothetical protein
MDQIKGYACGIEVMEESDLCIYRKRIIIWW